MILVDVSAATAAPGGCSVGRPNASVVQFGRSTERDWEECVVIRRALTFGYGVVAYLAFLAVFGYTIGFLANAGVPKGVDDGPVGPAWAAILVDAGLLGLFAVQ